MSSQVAGYVTRAVEELLDGTMASNLCWEPRTTSFSPRLSGVDGILVHIGFSPRLAVRSCTCPENATRGGGRGRQGMAPVLVVESDDDVRDVLHDLLTDAAGEATQAPTHAAPFTYPPPF